MLKEEIGVHILVVKPRTYVTYVVLVLPHFPFVQIHGHLILHGNDRRLLMNGFRMWSHLLPTCSDITTSSSLGIEKLEPPLSSTNEYPPQCLTVSKEKD